MTKSPVLPLKRSNFSQIIENSGQLALSSQYVPFEDVEKPEYMDRSVSILRHQIVNK
jgi:hypothetical protein